MFGCVSTWFNMYTSKLVFWWLNMVNKHQILKLLVLFCPSQFRGPSSSRSSLPGAVNKAAPVETSHTYRQVPPFQETWCEVMGGNWNMISKKEGGDSQKRWCQRPKLWSLAGVATKKNGSFKPFLPLKRIGTFIFTHDVKSTSPGTSMYNLEQMMFFFFEIGWLY